MFSPRSTYHFRSPFLVKRSKDLSLPGTVKSQLDITLLASKLNDHSLVPTSAGGVLTSAHDNNQNWADHIELPNHIAPFLFSLPPMQKHDLVYFKELGDSFVIQWTRFINHGRLLEINFQLHLKQVIALGIA